MPVRRFHLLSAIVPLVVALVAAPGATAKPVGLDGTFGVGGTVLRSLGKPLGTGNTRASAVATQPGDNKLVVGGFARDVRNNKFALFRYNPDGSLDTTFNPTGMDAAGVPNKIPPGTVLTQIDAGDGSNDEVTSVGVLPGGKLIAAGYAALGEEAFALARYNPNGSLDTTLNPAGVDDVGRPNVIPPGTVLTKMGDANVARAESLVVQGDGKVVVAGFAKVAGTATTDFALARFKATASTTTSTGAQTLPAGTFNVASTAGFPSSGSFVVGGNTVTYTGITATSFTGCSGGSGTIDAGTTVLDGAPPLDETFGASGKVTTAIGTSKVATINSLAVQPDGKLIAAGTASNAAGDATKFAVARYNPDGSLDPSFGSGGVVLTPIGSGNAAGATSVIVLGSGVLVGGIASDGGVTKFALARYDRNGALDPSFGLGGVVLTSIGSDGAGGATSLIAQGSGVLAGGVASDGGVAKFALARYDQSGVLDPTFNSTGTVLTPVGNGGFASIAGLVLAGDRIVAAGYARDSSGATQLALARYTDLPEPPPPGPAPPPSPPAVCFPRLGVTVCPGATLPSQSSLRAAEAPCHVQASSASMSRSGRVKLRLACSTAAAGTLKLKASGRSVGSKSFSIAKGKSKTLTVKLSQNARRTLRKRHRLRARATVTFKKAGSATAAKSSTKTITIKG